MVGDTIYQPGEKSIFLQLLDPDMFLDRFEHNLRGEVLVTKEKKDSSGNPVVAQEWVKKFPPKMNDKGISSTISYLRIVCDKSISMTDLSEDMADTLSLQNTDNFTTFMFINYQNFGLTDDSQRDEIISMVRDVIVTRFHSCIGGMMVNAIAKTTNVTENKTMAVEQPQEQGKSIFGIRLPVRV